MLSVKNRENEVVNPSRISISIPHVALPFLWKQVKTEVPSGQKTGNRVISMKWTTMEWNRFLRLI